MVLVISRTPAALRYLVTTHVSLVSFVSAQFNATLPSQRRSDALRRWADRLMETRPTKLVAVATANKLARIAFALMRDDAHYAGILP